MASSGVLPCGIRLFAALFVACVFLAAVASSSEAPDSWSQTKASTPLKKCQTSSDLSVGKRKAFLQRLQMQCKKHKASSFFCDNLQLLLTLTTQSSKCNQLMAADVEPSLSDTLIRHPGDERDDFEDEVVSHLRRNKRDTSTDAEHDDKVEGSGDGNEGEESSREDRALKPKGDLIEDPSPDKHAVNIKKIDHMYDNLKSVLDWMMGLQVCDPEKSESKCAEGRQLNEVKDTLRYAVHMAVDQARDFFKNLSPSVQDALESSRSYDDLWSTGLNSVRSWVMDALTIKNTGNNDGGDSLARKINNWDHNMDSMTKWILEKGSAYLEDSKISKEKWYNNLNVVVNWAVKRGKAYFDIPDTAENSAANDVFVDNAAHAIARILPDQVTDLLVPEQTELDSQEENEEEEDENENEKEEDEARDANSPRRRRGKKKKRKLLHYFAAVAAVKAVLLKWGAIMSIKALAFKAMVVSSVALTMAIIAAFKKMGGGGHSKVVVASHHTSHDDHEWEDHWESSSQGGPGPGVDHGGWSSGGGGDQGWSSSQGGPIGGWGGRHPSGGGGGGGNWQATGGGGGWNNGGEGGGGGWNNWNGPGGGGGGGWGGNGGWGGKGWNRVATTWLPGQSNYAFPNVADTEDIQKRQGETPTSEQADEVPIAR